jgi:hypothetical protein
MYMLVGLCCLSIQMLMPQLAAGAEKKEKQEPKTA